ncbi:MAG: hypothetical protein FOGNACKC_00732 [Anaerolineae bacterium]|nr:hypothetical protein [Anaerolineae bacterium]
MIYFYFAHDTVRCSLADLEALAVEPCKIAWTTWGAHVHRPDGETIAYWVNLASVDPDFVANRHMIAYTLVKLKNHGGGPYHIGAHCFACGHRFAAGDPLPWYGVFRLRANPLNEESHLVCAGCAAERNEGGDRWNFRLLNDAN